MDIIDDTGAQIVKNEPKPVENPEKAPTEKMDLGNWYFHVAGVATLNLKTTLTSLHLSFHLQFHLVLQPHFYHCHSQFSPFVLYLLPDHQAFVFSRIIFSILQQELHQDSSSSKSKTKQVSMVHQTYFRNPATQVIWSIESFFFRLESLSFQWPFLKCSSVQISLSFLFRRIWSHSVIVTKYSSNRWVI